MRIPAARLSRRWFAVVALLVAPACGSGGGSHDPAPIPSSSWTLLVGNSATFTNGAPNPYYITTISTSFGDVAVAVPPGGAAGVSIPTGASTILAVVYNEGFGSFYGCCLSPCCRYAESTGGPPTSVLSFPF